MTQPGVYWWLDAPFVDLLGLYSNTIEGPGFKEAMPTAAVACAQVLAIIGQLYGVERTAGDRHLDASARQRLR